MAADHARLFRLPLPRAVFWLPAICLLAACGGGEPAGEGGTGGPTGGGPTPGGTAVVALGGEPDVLNPLISTTTVAGTVMAELFDNTTDLDEELVWQPAIAHRWELDPGGTGITYHLRPWRWADGEPMTARDFALTLALFKDPRVASPQRGFFADVVAAEARDDSTLHYAFTRPLADPLARTYHNVLPAHVVQDLDPAAVGSWALNGAPLSSGPFRLESWERGRQLALVRNERYPGTPARLDRVVFRVMPEVQTAILALEAGELDLVGGVPPADARRLDAGGTARIVPTGGRQLYYLQWNLRRPALADRDTRKALSLAVDRGRLVDTLVFGYGRPAQGPVAPACWNHHRELAPDPHDPARARALLEGAGWRDADGDGVRERDGHPLALEILLRQGDPIRENAAVILRENLRQVGVDVRLRALELGAALDLLGEGRFDAYLGLVTLNLYGDATPYLHSSAVDRFNQGAWADAVVDSLLERALGMQDRAAARSVWLEIQERVAADPPAAYLFYPEILVAVGPRLQDVRPHMLSPFNNLAQWWIRPEDRRYRSGP
ncbi:MAG: ABC transporter substrate-binding protein [Candidatus Krumholzibacteriia bacterium]